MKCVLTVIFYVEVNVLRLLFKYMAAVCNCSYWLLKHLLWCKYVAKSKEWYGGLWFV